MDIYLKRRRGKILLLIIAVLIGVASLLYTNWLTKKMATEERNKVEIWAEAIKGINNATIEITTPEMTQLQTRYLQFLGMVSEKNTTIPILILNPDGTFNTDRNITYREDKKEEVLRRELEKMQDYAAPITIDLGDDYKLMLYYRESTLLRNLRLYPIIQLIVILIFIVVAYFAFNATNQAEQNQVWVGMSKETAHQLGTPISSLMAWIELLKLKDVDPNLIKELEQDTARLERITERFSKIGSKPELLRVNLIEVLDSAVSYLKRRSSEKVKFELNYDTTANIETPLNGALFSWVIENLCKNAIDAMGNNGTITIHVKEKGNQVNIDLTDTGCGISKNHQKSIFHPGFSTKKRGWGLGLSLAKRIVEIYHNGKIFIKWSEQGKGTTFRIILNK
ncbi:HAMP domain-containing sensor histidine kinase [uncultured Draconibacterium sp.]|uniref:sensor histidine kinase n=1 Tax=uncultured Draconibacterium sp. TaxID=1573823 RepID=UPI002AA88B12|nr:HAMP domain-containing sensor histidine kinase [uncultured Draconibacterium sp.]